MRLPFRRRRNTLPAGRISSSRLRHYIAEVVANGNPTVSMTSCTTLLSPPSIALTEIHEGELAGCVIILLEDCPRLVEQIVSSTSQLRDWIRSQE